MIRGHRRQGECLRQSAVGIPADEGIARPRRIGDQRDRFEIIELTCRVITEQGMIDQNGSRATGRRVVAQDPIIVVTERENPAVTGSDERTIRPISQEEAGEHFARFERISACRFHR